MQDVLLRAHAAIRAGTVPERIDAWLLRMVRNAVVDAARAHARRAEDPLDASAPAPAAHAPETIVLRRELLRRTVDDVARLPDTQRRALLACAVDGRPADDVAVELGVSTPAVYMAVRRARQALVRTTAARDAACDGIRDQLDDAHARGVRAPESARLHLRDCTACARYRRRQRGLDRQLRLLAPPLLPLAGLLGGTGALVAGKPAVVAVGAIVAVAVGGVVVLEQRLVRSGEPSPVTLDHEGDPRGGPVVRGRRLPHGVSIIETRVRIATGERAPRHVLLHCPRGTVAGVLRPPRRMLPLQITTDRPNPSDLTTLRVKFVGPPPVRGFDATVRLPCRTPDRTGSVEAHPRRTRPGETPARVCPGDRRYVYVKPGRFVRGRLRGGSPVSILRWDDRRSWAYVVADASYIRGWAPRAALCRIGRSHG